MQLLHKVVRFLKDERGFVISSEAVLWATILGIGLIVGITMLRCPICNLFLDAAEGIAKKGQYEFQTNSDAFGFQVRTSPDVDPLLDPAGTAADQNFGDTPTRKTLIPASEEQN